MEFEKNTGAYFFNDFRVENFVALLEERIFFLTSNMLQDKYTNLSQFSDLKTEAELKNNEDFKRYLERADNWLLVPLNSKSLFQTHFVYYWVLQVAVNKTLQLVYSPKSFSKQVISIRITRYRDNLKKFIRELNELFYGQERHLYYEMFDSKGNL
jgi:hypothetical protein